MRSNATRSPFRILAFLAAGVASACAPAVQRVYLAATPETVQSRLEVAPSGGAQYVMVENRSSQDIFVTGVALRECRNIKNACEVTPMRITVPPNQTRRVLTVQVDRQNMPTGFRYSTSWEVRAPVIPTLQ